MWLCIARGIRGYLKQHKQQAIPREILAAYRTSRLSANVQSPFIGAYTDEERELAHKLKYVLQL